MHATVNEAVSSAERMNAKFLIMFHFSSRYGPIPDIDAALMTKCTIAFDLMSLQIKDQAFAKLSCLYAALKVLFPQEEEEDTEEGTASLAEPAPKKRKKSS